MVWLADKLINLKPAEDRPLEVKLLNVLAPVMVAVDAELVRVQETL
jgi:hypothetical protein